MADISRHPTTSAPGSRALTPRAEPAKLVVDDIDRLLIRELIADGRATLSNLAEKASLSVSAVQ